MRDWLDWHAFVVPGGFVAFHDARVFKDGWTDPEWGSVQAVTQILASATSSGWELVEEVDSLIAIRRAEL